MDYYLNYLSKLLNLEPIYIEGGFILLLLLITLVATITVLVRRYLFNKRVKNALTDTDVLKIFKEKYNKEKLLKRSKQIEKLIEKYGEKIIEITEITDIWIEELERTNKKKYFSLVLKYSPQNGFFKCFLASLKNKKLAGELIEKLKEGGEFLYLRKLALSGKGEEFDGKEALETFKDKIDEIREMTGDPEWPSRYFAVKILIHDNDKRSFRALWEALNDPYPLIRKTVVTEFNPETDRREKFFSRIYEILLEDPVFEVRQAAWERIKKDFSDLYKLELKTLKEENLLHALEILKTTSKEDENLALQIFEENNESEIYYYAGLFLNRAGVLRRLFLEVDLGDMKKVERNYQLLNKAVGVSISGFFNPIEDVNNPASLYIAAKILRNDGNQDMIPIVANKIFKLYRDASQDNKAVYLLPYKEIVNTISVRGNDKALSLLLQQLKELENIHNESQHFTDKRAEIIFSNIPERAGYILIDYLIQLLKNPDFRYPTLLTEAISKISPTLYLDRLTEIILAKREKYPHRVRINALKTLGKTKNLQVLQLLLENLPILPLQEAKEFVGVIAEYSGSKLEKKVEKLLGSVDSRIRATIISSLPTSEQQKFAKLIKKAMDDSDPEVRIASVFALSNLKDHKSSNQIANLLRDPVERVRTAAAQTLAQFGTKDSLNLLKGIIYNNNEIDAVKKAIVKGLGESDSEGSLTLLLDILENNKELTQNTITALSNRRDKSSIKQIIEAFKDADPTLRDSITDVFKQMGEQSEPAIEALLKEEITSLHPYITEILEKTGYVESKIRKLKHRDSNERVRAAEILSLIGTPSAFRGIVLASRDPNRDVRVKVVKALEKLEKDEGKEILAALENDPDKKIRKYTQWALERLRSKALV